MSGMTQELTHAAYRAAQVKRAQAALTRAQDRLDAALVDLEPLEAEFLESGSAYVPPPLRVARNAHRVATESVARATLAVADARGRQTAPTLEGLE